MSLGQPVWRSGAGAHGKQGIIGIGRSQARIARLPLAGPGRGASAQFSTLARVRVLLRSQ